MIKRFIFTLAVLLMPLHAFAREVLVLASAATNMLASAAPRTTTAVEIQNLGPNPIWCEIDGSTPVVNKSHKIESGGMWTISSATLQVTSQVKCLASTADQVTGAATIINEAH